MMMCVHRSIDGFGEKRNKIVWLVDLVVGSTKIMAAAVAATHDFFTYFFARFTEKDFLFTQFLSFRLYVRTQTHMIV